MSQITTSYSLARDVGNAVLALPIASASSGALLETVFAYLQDPFAPPNDPLLDRIFGMAVPDKQEGEEAWCTMARRCKDLAKQVINGELPRYQAVAERGMCRIREVPCPNSDWVNDVAVFPNGDFLVAVTCSSGARDSVRKFRQDGQLIGQYNLHAGEVRKLAIARDGKSFLSAGEDALILSSDTGTELRRFSYSQENIVTALAFSPSGKEFLLCLRGEYSSMRSIEKWDCDGRARQPVIKCPAAAHTIRAFPDGSGFITVFESQMGFVSSDGWRFTMVEPEGGKGRLTDALVLSNNKIVVPQSIFQIREFGARVLFYTQQGKSIGMSTFFTGCDYPRIAASPKSEDAFFFADAEEQGRVRYCWGNSQYTFLTPRSTHKRSGVRLAAFTDGRGFVTFNVGEENPKIRICDFDLNPKLCQILKDGTILDDQGNVLRPALNPENKDSKDNKQA